jgi:hypothetical protein
MALSSREAHSNEVWPDDDPLPALVTVAELSRPLSTAVREAMGWDLYAIPELFWAACVSVRDLTLRASAVCDDVCCLWWQGWDGVVVVEKKSKMAPLPQVCEMLAPVHKIQLVCMSVICFCLHAPLR